VPRRVSYVPKHRAPRVERSLSRNIRRSVTLGGLAVTATGLAVSSGVVLPSSGSAAGRAGSGVSTPLAADRTAPRLAAALPTPARLSAVQLGTGYLGDRTTRVSRSAQRSSVRATRKVEAVKRRALAQSSGGQVTQTEDLTGGDPRTVARAMLPQFGFGSDQFGCLDSLYNRESGWNVHADNPSSSAYGIPQALPGSKMSSAGPNWANDAATQIRWGLGYIKARYGTPCGAWGHSQSNGWY
jgi:hypothetical protein